MDDDSRMTDPTQRVWWRIDLLVALAGAAAIGLWDASGLDLVLMRHLADGSGFAMREHWFFSGVAHRGGYWISVALFLIVLLSCVGPWHSRHLDRSRRIAWFSAMAACLLLIPALKHVSLTSCPWELAEFGGRASYVSHWAFGLADGGSGHCFPGGHASGAFAFLGGWFAWRDRRPRVAAAWLLGVVLLGMLFGLTQTVRGAHYFSHTLYTAWICWCLSALLFGLIGRANSPAAPTTATDTPRPTPQGKT
ncbi:MAG: hypothetical protein RLZZ598_1961 [Pseudomonadota bacterium]|jgi:membrane-associated PAP2 superfamily phosphatase